MPVSMNSNAIIFTQQRRLSASLDGLLAVHCPSVQVQQTDLKADLIKVGKSLWHKFEDKKKAAKPVQAIYQKCSARSAIHIAMCLKQISGSVLVLNLLAQILKACFSHTEAKN